MLKINFNSGFKSSFIPSQIDSSGTNTARGFTYFQDSSIDNTEGFGAFADVKEYLPSGTNNIDIGGGRFDETTEYLREHFQVQNVVYDPFTRSEEHNNETLFENKKSGCLRSYHSATSMSVLNVINLEESRREHIELMFEMIRPGGVALFKVYNGDGSGVEKITEMRYQSNKGAEYYFEEVARVFGRENTFLKPNGIPNLIVAYKFKH